MVNDANWQWKGQHNHQLILVCIFSLSLNYIVLFAQIFISVFSFFRRDAALRQKCLQQLTTQFPAQNVWIDEG